MKTIGGFLLGAIVGGAIGVLLAPMKGKKLRKQITKKTEDIIDEVKDYVESAEDYLKDTSKKAETLINDAKKIISTY